MYIMEELLLMRSTEMSDTMMSSVPAMTENAQTAQGSNAEAAVLLVVGVSALAGTYYAVRRGIDRRIARQIKKHLKREE